MSQPAPREHPANLMQRPRIEKVVLNISVGQSGEPLQQAMSVLKDLTGQNPSQRLAKRSIRDWGVHRREPIACLVTLRNEAAVAFLKRAFDAVDRRLPRSSFDLNGNFAFGLSKHIDLPGVRYDPDLGIVGMDISVAMGKLGYRVKRRRLGKAHVGKKQKLTRDEAIEHIQDAFGLEILGD
jgi:large subunit ribosomal protein L5